MQDGQVPLGGVQLIRGKDVTVLQADVVVLVEEALTLDTGHVEDIQLGHGLLQRGGLHKLNAVALQQVSADTLGDPEFIRRDQHKLHILVAGHSANQGVDGAAELQVAAAADDQVVQTPLLPLDGEQVGQGLGGVVVAAVTGIDDGNGGIHGCHQRCTLLGVAHGNDIGKAADGLCGVGHALALGGRGTGGIGEAQDLAAQFVHSRLKAQAGTGGGLVKQGCQLLIAALLPIVFRMLDDILRHSDELIDLFHG